LYTKTREEQVRFIKKLLCNEKALCPKCEKGYLEHFHKKAKKSNTDYICPFCNERYKVINLISEIN